jgi:hypothetical protein
VFFLYSLNLSPLFLPLTSFLTYLINKGQSKLQFEYAGSKINFVAGELEMLSSSKISEIEIIGRTKLLKRIAYFTELYEWKGLKKILKLKF